MSEYTEQPAFETNDFKVGDRVRVYGFGETIPRCDVTAVDGELIGSGHSRYHFKQCRLLVKRGPREGWVYFCNLTPAEPMSDLGNYIKVREVFDA